MRQVNVVGAGPFSQSSRVIQTLQAPPDVAPTSITVRTASETSLRLRWVVSRGVGSLELRCRFLLPLSRSKLISLLNRAVMHSTVGLLDLRPSPAVLLISSITHWLLGTEAYSLGKKVDRPTGWTYKSLSLVDMEWV